MFRFSLRTLIVVMLLGGPMCAWGWLQFEEHARWQASEQRRPEFIRWKAFNDGY